MYNQSYRELIKKFSVSQEDVGFFAKMPFVRPYVEKFSVYQPVPFVTRYDKGDPSDKFFNKTINSNDTIPRVLALMRKEYPLKPQSTGNEDREQPQVPEEPHFVVFFQLEPGVNGYVNTAHGGVLAALLDETMGLCAEIYRVFVSSEQVHLLTAKLEVSYHSPLPTPGLIVIKTWVKRKEGRKWFLEAHILDHEGSLKATAKSVYVRLQSPL
jgi:acyl-coenzyme A thioesterase PaaI-like protein